MEVSSTASTGSTACAGSFIAAHENCPHFGRAIRTCAVLLKRVVSVVERTIPGQG